MSSSEEVQSFNQILGIIDEKAALYKEERFDMPAARKKAEQKMILDLIADALKLAARLEPQPLDTITDLKKLERDMVQF